MDESKGVGQVVGAISWMSHTLMIDQCVVAGSSHVGMLSDIGSTHSKKTEMPRIKQPLVFFPRQLKFSDGNELGRKEGWENFLTLFLPFGSRETLSHLIKLYFLLIFHVISIIFLMK